jgi:hypothetical protein
MASGGPTALWSQLRAAAGSHERPVQLIIGDTADAACAARSLMRLLRVNRILFDAHMVTKPEYMASIARDNADSALDETERDTYVLVGCGATVDLTGYFDMSRVRTIFLLDAHRPINLNNMRTEGIVVWDADSVGASIDRFFVKQNRKVEHSAGGGRRRRRTRGSRVKLERARVKKQHRRDGDEFSDATSESDEGETEDDDESVQASGTEAEDSASNSGASGSDDDDGPVDAEDLVLGDGRRIDWREGTVPPRMERAYYATSWYDTPVAVQVFDLAVNIGQQHDTVTWNASVGCADALLRRVLSPAAYEVEYQKLADAVNQAAAARRTLMLNDVTHEYAAEGQRAAATCSWRLKCGFDHAMFCLNHCSLQEAMELDAALAAKLRMHLASEGPTNVSELFAHVGVSLPMARRRWSELGSETRSDVMQRLGRELVRLRYVLPSFQLTRRAVSRVVGFGTEVSPFDACHLFYAEASRTPPRSVMADPDAVREHFRRNYWNACEVLDASPHSKPFANALNEAMAVAEAVRQATADIMSGGMVMSPHVHYTLLGQRSNSQVIHELCHPARLRILADHVIEATSTTSRRHRSQPFLVGCPVPNAPDGTVGAGAVSIVLCALPFTPGPLHTVNAIADIGIARHAVPGAQCDQFDPLVTTVPAASTLDFLESVHLQLTH